MSHPLIYLWLTLLKRQTLYHLRGLKRPTTLIGFVALSSLLGFFLYFRAQHGITARMGRASLVGAGLVMLGGSLFKGFLQRGLVFDPADVEFLFTGPFTQRQIVIYRLLPNYLFAIAQGALVFWLVGPYLHYPATTSVCLVFLQIACFHVATGAAIFAGTLSGPTHHRARWMLLGSYFMVTGIYLRAAWEIKLVPSFVSSAWMQLFFYPAVTVSDLGAAPSFREWSLRLMRTNPPLAQHHWEPVLAAGFLAVGAVASLWFLLRIKANVFETSLETTARVAEKRLRAQQGLRAAGVVEPTRSAALPKLAFFHGVGAIVWKNLIVARRSKKELIVALVFTLVYTAPLVALLHWHHNSLAQTSGAGSFDTDFDNGMVSMVAGLAFLLQWAFPFDFRRDGHHLLNFRTLPFPAITLVLAELAVPTAFCLAFQAFGIVALLLYGQFDWFNLFFILLADPAVSLALNGVWNLHYLLSAAKRAAGHLKSRSPVGTLMVVALSFLIFFPAGWSAVKASEFFPHNAKAGLRLAAAVWFLTQYFIDFLLVIALAKLFARFEISSDSK